MPTVGPAVAVGGRAVKVGDGIDVSANLTGTGEGVTGVGVAVGEGVVERVGVNVGPVAGVPVDVTETNAVGMVSVSVGLTSAPFPPTVAARLA
jgi:hypothetical protein